MSSRKLSSRRVSWRGIEVGAKLRFSLLLRLWCLSCWTSSYIGFASGTTVSPAVVANKGAVVEGHGWFDRGDMGDIGSWIAKA
jgi:hypothetical protein